MTTTRQTAAGPSTETARDVADMIADRGYPGVAEQLRDVADEIDDDHVHPRPDGLWTTEPIPAALAGHITGAQPTGPKTAARSPGQVVYEATVDAESVAQAVAGALGDLIAFDEEFGREVMRRITRDAVRSDDPEPVSTKAPIRRVHTRLRVTSLNADVLGDIFSRPGVISAESRPVVGEFYRLRADVDRLGVPTDAARVRVLHITRDESSVLVDWPDLPPGPAHQQAMVPATHLVVTQ